MLRKSFVLMVVGTVVFFLCSISSADVPDSINYQGKLTTAAGGCLNDTVQMTFTIYSDELGISDEWSETQTEVVVKEGIFNVLLGSVNPLPGSLFDGSVKYLGVQVEADPEMRPLIPIVSVPYAYMAGGGGGGWVDDGGVVRLADSTDYVGIGTADPQGPLQVGEAFIVSELHSKVGINDMSPDAALEVVPQPTDDVLMLSSLAANNGDLFIVKNSGNVGIGTTEPEGKLEVKDNAMVSYLTEHPPVGYFGSETPNKIALIGDASAGASVFISPGKNIGVYGAAIGGTENWAGYFDGDVLVKGFKMTTGASNDYVLTSDANGVGTWQPAAGVSDNDWVFPTSAGGTNPRLYLYTYGPWGIARYGNTLYGSNEDTHVNLGVSSVTGESGYNHVYCTVGGGLNNTASGSFYIPYPFVGGYTTVGGGLFNTARADTATIGGGAHNDASGVIATIGGGQRNTVTDTGGTIAGGKDNTANRSFSTVGGGKNNTVTGHAATVPGGLGNTITYNGAFSFAAGKQVTVDGSNTFAFGYDFTTSASHAVIFNDNSGIPIKVGIQTNAPNTTTDINGDIALREGSFTAGNGPNDNINIGQRSFVRIVGPSSAFSIQGIAGGKDGKMVILYNATSFSMTIENDNSSTAANGIWTMSGADEPTTGTGNVTLIYDATDERWIVTAMKP